MSMFAALKQSARRHNSYYWATIVAAAFATEIIVDKGVDAFWDWNNRGVCHSLHEFVLKFSFRNCGVILSHAMYKKSED